MTTTTDEQRQIEQYKDVTMSAFADFSGLEEAELRVAFGGARELLRAGGPVHPGQIAGAVDLPPRQVEEILRRHAELGWVFFDDEDRVAAMWAIGGPESGHTFEVDGRPMPTWCALDTVLLPNWLNVTARVTSRDPVTKQPITFTVGRDGIEDLHPAGAVVSAYEPDGPITQDVRNSFCHFVNFFESAEVGLRWAERQGGRRFRFLPLDVAFLWAKDFTRSFFKNYPAPELPGRDGSGSEAA